MRRNKVAVGVAIAFGMVVAAADPAGAHGIGKRGDLPLPLWQFVWAAVLAIGVSVVAAGFLWTAPRLAGLASGRALPAPTRAVTSVLSVVARVVGLGVFAATLGAALFVDESLEVNITPWTIFVALWVGMQFVSVIFGDVYRYINPIDTLAAGIEAVQRRLKPGWTPLPTRASHWPAVAGMTGFLWLELAYHSASSPRLLGWLMVSYSLVYLTATVRYGREWLHTSEAFASFFSLLAALSPIFRGPDGRLRLRIPGSGLASLRVLPGTAALILVTLGGTTFDGLSRTELWANLVEGRSGWDLTFISTLGMAWTIAAVTSLYAGAARLVARIVDGSRSEAFDWFVPSLVPIALGYAIAHYFSLFVLDGGQDFLIRLSDPFAQGWDLFGTGDWRVNFLLVSATTIAWVQAIGIIAGHVGGVLAAHDRALEVYDKKIAMRSQYPMIGVMIIYTVGALVLLLGA